MFTPHAFLIALQFLTTLPIRLNAPPDNTTMGRSLLYYPLVGLLLGLFLGLLATALGWTAGAIPTGLHAAIVLACWVVLTGALHLDGLADSADAWLGGLGDRERTLEIMKDPYCGPVAVVSLVLVLLIKFTALEYLLTTGSWEALVLTLVLSRTTLVLIFLTTPYVRPNGLGSLLAIHLPRRTCSTMVGLILVGVLLVSGVAAFWLLLSGAGVFFGLRALMLRRIGGATGDTAGALVEITEAVMLLTAALIE